MANVLPEGWTGEQSVGQCLETRFYSGYKPSGGEWHRGKGQDRRKGCQRSFWTDWRRACAMLGQKHDSRKYLLKNTKLESESSQMRVATPYAQHPAVSMCSHWFTHLCFIISAWITDRHSNCVGQSTDSLPFKSSSKNALEWPRFNFLFQSKSQRCHSIEGGWRCCFDKTKQKNIQRLTEEKLESTKKAICWH